jgi:hypothetical protein
MLVLFYSYIDSIVVFDSYTTFRAKNFFWAEYPGAISWRRHCLQGMRTDRPLSKPNKKKKDKIHPPFLLIANMWLLHTAR